MRPDLTRHPDFFETPARAERLQLLLHLARNAVEPVYLRAPAGAGKSRLVARLQQGLGDELAICRLDLSEPIKPIAGILQQLGLPPEAADHWPQQLIARLGDRQLLIIVDPADALDEPIRQVLTPLSEAGVRLLLVGRGGGAGDWPVQQVDLPPFSAAETAAFLRALSGGSADRITDEVAVNAHASAKGLPGPLLDALEGLLATASPGPKAAEDPIPAEVSLTGKRPVSVEQRQDPADEGERASPVRAEPNPSPTPPSPTRPNAGAEPPRRTAARHTPRPMDADKVLRGTRLGPWAWAGAAALTVALVAVLVFQDRINALFAPPEQQLTAAAPVSSPDPVVAADAPELAPASPHPAASAPVDAAVGPVKEPSAAVTAAPVPTDQDPLVTLKQTGDSPESSLTLPDPGEAADEPGVTAESPDARIDDAVESLMPPISGLDDGLAASSEDESAPPIAGSDDPLDAVMHDALEAERQVVDDAPVEPPVPTVAPTSPAASDPPVTKQPPPAPPTDGAAAVVEATRPSATAPPNVVQAQAGVPDSGAIASGDDNRDVAAPTPAPVEERSAAAIAVAKPAVPSTTAAPSPAPSLDGPGSPAPVVDRTMADAAPAVEESDPVTGEPWLDSRSPGHYTLQLVGARDRQSLLNFAKKHGISPPFAIFERELKGAPWFSLVAGDYPDRAAAVAARARLPAALSGAGVWPRTFASIQSSR